MRCLCLIIVLVASGLAAWGCNDTGLISNPAASSTATPTTTSTVVPSPTVVPTSTPCDPAVVSMPPNITTVWPYAPDQVNANYYLILPDTLDGDNDEFEFVWSCTTSPLDASPHKEIQTWNLSAEPPDGGDLNTLLSGPTEYPCCYTVP